MLLLNSFEKVSALISSNHINHEQTCMIGQDSALTTKKEKLNTIQESSQIDQTFWLNSVAMAFAQRGKPYP